MVDTIRCCTDCASDISDRHGNATRCKPCASRKQRQVTAHYRPRTSPCLDESPECVPGRLRLGRCGRHYGRLKATRTKGPVDRTCLACGSSYRSSDPRKVTCSTACRLWMRKHPATIRITAATCLLCGSAFDCGRASMRYCSSRCRFAAEKRRNRSVASAFVVRAQCLACGATMPLKRRAGSKYCSAKCGERYYNAPDRFAERFGRTCENCGTAIQDGARLLRRFCSTLCQNRANQHKRRVRKRGLPVENVNRAEIFERDDWTCHLCSKEITSGPTLDHLIPVSHPLCPGHVWENLAAAHRSCNSSKNHRVRAEDWDLHRRLLAMKGGDPR